MFYEKKGENTRTQIGTVRLLLLLVLLLRRWLLLLLPVRVAVVLMSTIFFVKACFLFVAARRL